MLANEEQHLTHSSVTSVHLPDSQHSPVISAEKLKQLYTLMVRLRACEQTRSTAKGKRRALRFGEACEVAVVVDLHRGDTVATLPGQHVGLLAGSGRSTNRNDEQGPAAWSVLEEDARDRLAIAAGLALAHRLEQRSSVVVAFAAVGEIASASDSVRFAQKQNLPIIYVEKTAPNGRKSKPTPHEIPAIPVDKNDAVAVYRVAYEAIDKARRGVGPTVIRCIRHQNPSARSRLRDQRADPIAYMEHYLRKQNLWSDDVRF